MCMCNIFSIPMLCWIIYFLLNLSNTLYAVLVYAQCTCIIDLCEVGVIGSLCSGAQTFDEAKHYCCEVVFSESTSFCFTVSVVIEILNKPRHHLLLALTLKHSGNSLSFGF